MNISACRPYHAAAAGQGLLRSADGKSVFKVYYVSIIGRDDPARYEWEHCALTKAEYESGLGAQGIEGIGFVLAFPHITKAFRFSPKSETVMDVKAFDTQTLEPLDLGRDGGFVEFACYAEAAIAADEYRAWADAETVDEYLAFRSVAADFPVASHTKLSSYWA